MKLFLNTITFILQATSSDDEVVGAAAGSEGFPLLVVRGMCCGISDLSQ